VESAEWGDGVVNQLASFIARTQPGQRGFSRPNLFRMKQFYEAYRDEPKVSALTRQILGFRTMAVVYYRRWRAVVLSHVRGASSTCDQFPPIHLC
jgi:hypothetical protein